MEELRVHGTVRWVHGELATGVTVSAYDTDLRHENFLGESIADESGYYEIKYKARQFHQSEEKSADLIFRLFDRRGMSVTIAFIIFDDQQLDASSIIFNAPADAQIDLVVEPEHTGLSEYERFMATLVPVLGNVPLADLIARDVEFLTGETNLAEQHINFFVTAYRHAAVTNVNADVFYGLMRQGLPIELSVLLAEDPETQRDALKRAINDNIIPTYLPDQLDHIITQLQELRKKARN